VSAAEHLEMLSSGEIDDLFTQVQHQVFKPFGFLQFYTLHCVLFLLAHLEFLFYFLKLEISDFKVIQNS